jgi:hypothetical protein
MTQALAGVNAAVSAEPDRCFNLTREDHSLPREIGRLIEVRY